MAKIIAVLCLLIGLAGVSLFFQGLVLFVDAVAHVYPDATGLGIIGGPILMALGIVLSCAFIGVVSLLDFKLKYFIMVVIIVALFSSLVAVRRLIFWEKSQTGAAYHQQPEKIRGIPWNKSR
ncbi:MAG: hypothetical protein HZB36_00220 [Candidatus Omnitrophica bacterium]|nr:hypothetical protein [Candidatus Omnitrophota bacterium]